MTGTISIRCNTLRGDIPNAISPAQLNDPITPAEPVPDDHAVIAFLDQRKKHSINSKYERFVWVHLSKQNNYLLN